MARKEIGTVTSTKQNKTIVVTITERKTHPLYRKQYTTSKKFYAHDENEEANEGDKVSIVETRPISKMKKWKLESVVEKVQTTESV